jgi:hypothetical protein
MSAPPRPPAATAGEQLCYDLKQAPTDSVRCDQGPFPCLGNCEAAFAGESVRVPLKRESSEC